MGFGERIGALLDRVPAPLTTRLARSAAARRIISTFANPFLPAHPTRVVVKAGAGKGLSLLIYPRSEKYFWTGAHEERVQQVLVGILARGATFWDVGANIGFMSLIASRAVGDEGRVHAFEPLPANLERLRESIRLNGVNNVTVHPFALARASGNAILHAHDSPLMWSLDPVGHSANGIDVACRTLDDVAAESGPPDLVKIDVEGAELDVLRGGVELVRTACPPLIVEFTRAEMIDEARALLPRYECRLITGVHVLFTAGRSHAALAANRRGGT
jgi:FkbM family methyltransferase